jgi:hypothetical protein
VVGVENLFTPQFYDMAKEALSEQGVFMQWTHLYSMTPPIFASMLENISAKFKYLRLYKISSGDVAILASMSPLTSPHLEQRWREEVVSQRHELAGLVDPQQLELLQLYNEKELRFIGQTLSRRVHDLETPTLSYRASQAFFLDVKLAPDILIPPDVSRFIREMSGESLAKLLQDLVAQGENSKMNQICLEPLEDRKKFVCLRLKDFVQNYRSWLLVDKKNLNPEGLTRYRDLRQMGLIQADLPFLRHQWQQAIAQRSPPGISVLIAQEFAKERQWDESKAVLMKLADNHELPENEIKRFLLQLAQTREEITKLLAAFSNL